MGLTTCVAFQENDPKRVFERNTSVEFSTTGLSLSIREPQKYDDLYRIASFSAGYIAKKRGISTFSICSLLPVF